MKKLFSLIAVVSILCIPLTVHANSSWQWVSKIRPTDILPIVIILTLVIEIIAINYVPKTRCLNVVIPVVVLANLISFLFPYFYTAIDSQNPYNVYYSGDYLESIDFMVSHGPFYTVSVMYLIMTLLVETPIVYLILRKRAENRRLLFGVIIGANVLTTIITIVIEQTTCFGRW